MGANNPDAFRRQTNEVRSVFGDLPIVEAPADLVVYVQADEHQSGVRGDPNNCMFALACKRAFGSRGVLFFPTVAYVDMIDLKDSSRRVVMRFLLPRGTRERLEEFDREEGETLEATFRLKAVPEKATLDYMAKQARKRAKRRAASVGDNEQARRRRASAKKGHATRQAKALMGVRSGSGQIHTRNGGA